jgi:YVTN family beta-propeller protein
MDWKNKIVVANTQEDSLSFIDPKKKAEVYCIQLQDGAGPCGLAKIQDTSNLIIVQSNDNSLACINLEKGSLEKVFFVGCCPSFIAVSHKTHEIYVTNADSDSISIVHNRENLKLVGQIPVGSMPQGIDCHPWLPLIAVANMNSHDIWFIETEKYNIINRVQVDDYPSQLKFSRNGKRLYVGCYFNEFKKDGRLILIDLHGYGIIYEMIVGCIPLQMVETRDGKYLLIASTGTGRLEIVDCDSRSIINEIEIGSMVYGVALDAQERYAYVTNMDEGTVSMIDWKKGNKVADIKVGKEPRGIVCLD